MSRKENPSVALTDGTHISHTHLRIDHDKRHLGEVDATNNVEDDLFKLDVWKHLVISLLTFYFI